jgi:uncharacterized protein (TIGR03086 family)
MASRPDTVYLEGLDLFSSVVGQFPADDWEQRSPCPDWRALDVLGHVGATTAYGIELLRGGTPTWRPSGSPADAVEGDPVEWWRALAEEAGGLTRRADLTQMLDTPTGRRSVADRLSFGAIDLVVHAWDLGRCAGIGVEIPVEAIEFAHGVLDKMPAEQLRRPGVFAEEVTPQPDASPTEALIARTGRVPRSTAS